MSATNITVTSGTGSSTIEVITGNGSTDISVSYGDRGPAGPQGESGEAAPITTETETNLTGFIYGNGINVGGAVGAIYAGVNSDAYYGKLVQYSSEDAFLWTPGTIAFGFGPQDIEDPLYSTLNGQYYGHSWILPDASGTISLEGHQHDASDITSGTFNNARINFAAPSAIGSGTPNTGAFTTLSATGTATLPHIHGSLAGDLYIHVKNTTGGPLTRGTPVYIVGNVGDTDRVEIAAADNTNPAKMPAVGLLDQDLANNGEGDAVILGELPAANTNAYSLNQELFVGVGALTGTKPTSGEVQSVGVVSRVQSNSGVIVVNMQNRRTPDGAFAAAVHTHTASAISDSTSAGRTLLTAADHQAQITALSNVTNTASTSITLTAADSGKILRCTSSSAVTINMPSTDPAGNFSVAVIREGTGTVTFAANGKTINSYNNLLSIAGQHAWASVIRVAADTYNLSGTLA